MGNAATLFAGVCLLAVGMAAGWFARGTVTVEQKPAAARGQPVNYQERVWAANAAYRYELVNETYGIPERMLDYWPSLAEAEQAGRSRACVDHVVHDKSAGRWQRVEGATCRKLSDPILDLIREQNRATYAKPGVHAPSLFMD